MHIASFQCKNGVIWIIMHWNIPFLVKKIKWETEDVIETKDKFLQDTHRIIVGNNHTENNKKTSKLVNKFWRKKMKKNPKGTLMGRNHWIPFLSLFHTLRHTYTHSHIHIYTHSQHFPPYNTQCNKHSPLYTYYHMHTQVQKHKNMHP